MKRHSPLVHEVVIALAERGHVADVDLNGTDFEVRSAANGRCHLLVIARSPSSRRAAVESRAILRRLLREEGRSQ